MTSFAYPVQVKLPEEAATAPGNVRGKVPAYFTSRVSAGATGVGPGSTTLPLFVAPAGSRVFDCVIDVLTASDQGASNTNLRVGVSTSTGIIFAATTVNTAGRRVQTMSAAQVSANAIVFSVDTTIQALVSIETSALTTLDVLVHTIVI